MVMENPWMRGILLRRLALFQKETQLNHWENHSDATLMGVMNIHSEEIRDATFEFKAAEGVSWVI
jgi:hypothetical protein